jgi:hypothetical protein
LWAELGRQIKFFLGGITLADVVLGRVAGKAVGAPAPSVAAMMPEEARRQDGLARTPEHAGTGTDPDGTGG